MLYIPVLGFTICAIIKLAQHDTNAFFLFTILTGLYLIPATIQNVYEQWVQKKTMEYQAMSNALNDWANKLKDEKEKYDMEMKKQRKYIKRKI